MPSAGSPASKFRFVCDEQLGRLAKWLRVQGFDTLYECPMEDKRLLQIAQKEKRILLTRDRQLPSRTLWPAIVMIENAQYGEQVRELTRKIKLPKTHAFSRCLSCNEPFELLSQSQVKGKVPEAVYKFYEKFFTCPSCKKIFWEGSHVQASRKRLAEMGR